MSKRSRIPAPFQKLLPSIIRGAGPRLLVTMAACALLLIGGGTYLVSHIAESQPAAPKPQQPINQVSNVPETGKVLGDNTAPPPAPAQTSSPSTSTQGSNAASSPAAPAPAQTCTSDCGTTGVPAVLPPLQPIQPLLNAVNQSLVQPVITPLRQTLSGLL
ncbi:MAG: hypothetical protein WDN27_05335 [Candidatus Saccharibacteria bacterium]